VDLLFFFFFLFGPVCVLFGLVGVTLKVVTLKKFRLNDGWFKYGNRIAFRAWRDCGNAYLDRYLNLSYAIAIVCANAALILASILLFIYIALGG